MNPSRIRALLATLRIANMPSVICNVWLGIALALATTYSSKESIVYGPKITSLIVAGLFLYAAGNLLNDWKDDTWDQSHRPERALPSGLFKPTTYLTFSIVLTVVAISLATLASPHSGITAALIAACIAIYTNWHKGHAWTVIPMGLCRALLPVMGVLAFAPSLLEIYLEDASHITLPALNPADPSLKWLIWIIDPPVLPILWILPHALALFFYIMGLSLSARAESNPQATTGETWIARSLLIASVLAMSVWWMPYTPLPALIGMLPILFWLTLSLSRFRKPIPAHVSALLAGIPLLDWAALIPLAASLSPRAADMHWVSITSLILPPVAFLSGRLLQRIAPAT
jgi:4-hydroxybenzoate polyprenyltransferase